MDEIQLLLGLDNHRSMPRYEFSKLISEGLPIQALYRLCREICPNEKTFAYTLIPRTTLRRRRKQRVLSTRESEMLVRLAQIWLVAFKVFQSKATARRFVSSPHPLLGGEKPMDLAKKNYYGAKAVEDILGKLKYGSAA